MAKFKNVSPLGALDLALVGRIVGRGEVIEVTAAQAVHLAGQEGTWEPVRDTSRRSPRAGRKKAQTGSQRATRIANGEQQEGGETS